MIVFVDAVCNGGDSETVSLRKYFWCRHTHMVDKSQIFKDMEGEIHSAVITIHL